MTPRNLTELRKANDNHTQTDRNTTGGISADVLPRGSVLSGTLEIRVLEQMPRRGNPAHSHFLPLLPSPPIRPRNLPQRPHTMKTTPTRQQNECARTKFLADHMAAEARRRRESMEEKQAMRLALMSRHTPLDKAKAKEAVAAFVLATGSKNQPRGNR